MIYDLINIGGGAAGFFTAIQLAERKPGSKILILEKSNKVLSKLKVSGGGRCNVTHACFIPQEMVEHYPRGKKELLGPFHQFLCGDMMEWLGENGVETKIEEDGRIFPLSNNSQSIIDCFLNKCQKNDIEVKLSESLLDFEKGEDLFMIKTQNRSYQAKNIMMATGSTPSMWKLLAKKGFDIIDPVPSLFTFNIKSPLLKDLMGLSVPMAEVMIEGLPYSDSGPLLITHWGLSGPAILKLSSWAARELHSKNYDFSIRVNWINQERKTVLEKINSIRSEKGNSGLKKNLICDLPKRLWERMLEQVSIRSKNYGDLSNLDIESLCDILCSCELSVKGKSTFKEEFVTCGGVDTKEINFKSMESKRIPGLYFAGEVINVDAITGGFNFQAAWTESFIAAKNMANNQFLQRSNEI